MRHHLKADGQLLTVMLTLNEQGTTEQYFAEQNWCDAECEKINLKMWMSSWSVFKKNLLQNYEVSENFTSWHNTISKSI